MILHADSEASARQLEASIREQGIPFKEIWVRWVGPVIGSHEMCIRDSWWARWTWTRSPIWPSATA